MLRMVYFAWVREAVGMGEEVVDAPPDLGTVGALLDWLGTVSEPHARAFADRGRLRAAVDGAFVGLDAGFEDAAEVAIFPPVTGG